MGAEDRGYAIDETFENKVGHNHPKINRFDFDSGIATSVKSRDLRCKAYHDASKLEYLIEKDVDSLINYKGSEDVRVIITDEMIKDRQLQLVVPDISLTENQIRAINNAVKYAQSKKVEIIITVAR